MDVLGILAFSIGLITTITAWWRLRVRRERAKLPPPTPPPVNHPRPPTQPERIDAHVTRAIQLTETMRAATRRDPRTPAYGLASKIASKLTEDLVVDATVEDLSGVTFQLDELSDDALLEIYRLLELDPLPEPPNEPTARGSRAVTAITVVDRVRPDFEDEADTVLRSTPPPTSRRFGTPTPTPTPV